MTCSPTARSSGGSTTTALPVRRRTTPAVPGQTNGAAATREEAIAKFRDAWTKAKAGGLMGGARSRREPRCQMFTKDGKYSTWKSLRRSSAHRTR
jgi:hypothetical protein